MSLSGRRAVLLDLDAAHSRRQTLEKLSRLGFAVDERELVTPAVLNRAASGQ